MSKIRLVGGSVGLKVAESNNSYSDSRIPQLNMFIPDNLYPTVLKDKAKVHGFILPSFDSQMSEHDVAYSSSWEPYRDSATQDPISGNDAFTPWFVPLGEVDSKGYVTRGGIYQYFCNSKSTFLSPSLDPSSSDPIKDLRIHIYKMCNAGDTQYRWMVTRPTFNPSNPQETPMWVLPAPKMAYLVNAYCTGSNPNADDYGEMKNRILMLGSAAFNALIEDLDAYRPGNVAPIDPEYPDFMLGDITNPNRAIHFNSETVSSNITYVKLGLGKYNKRTGLVYTAENLVQLYPDALEGRYNLTDTANVVNIPTYDDVVNQIILEGIVPYSLVGEVCAKKCENFPDNPDLPKEVDETPKEAPKAQPKEAPKAQPKVTPKAEPDEEEEDEIPGLKDAPVWTAPVATPAAVPSPVKEKKEEPAAAAVSTSFTEEETKEFIRLYRLMQETSGVGMSVQDITAYSNLFVKAGPDLNKLIEAASK